MKKVSIIIPCYNQEKFIKEAIESALNQTYKNIEIICINDCSTDNSKEIIEELKKEFSFKFIDLKENKGVIFARNYAIDNCEGEYILPLDGDDTIEPTYIEKAVEVLENNPEIRIVYCKAKFFGVKNKVWNLPEFNLDDFLYGNCIFNCALFRKSDFYKAGKYKENLKDGCEDWDLWLSFVELGLKTYKINEILFNYRRIENSRTNHVVKSDEWKKELIKNHFDLYLDNEKFIEKVFSNNNRKVKKYKNLFYKTLLISIVVTFIQTIIIIGALCFQ